MRDPSAVDMPVAYEPEPSPLEILRAAEEEEQRQQERIRAAEIAGYEATAQSESCRVREERDSLRRENDQLRAELETARGERDRAVQIATCATRERDQVGQERNEARATIAELGQLAERMAARAAAGAVAGEVPPEELEAAEHLACLEYPYEPMLACSEAVLGIPGDHVVPIALKSCPRAAECHQVLAEKAPAIVELHANSNRVVGP